MDYKHKFIIKLFFDYLKKLIKMSNTSSSLFQGEWMTCIMMGSWCDTVSVRP